MGGGRGGGGGGGGIVHHVYRGKITIQSALLFLMFMQLHSNLTEEFKIKWLHHFFCGVYKHAVEQACSDLHQ